ncbi:MAG: hypothetical protein IJX38_05560 [Clostridia bacterium]|nr:hypothetical protein [Clostridia bacterium]
MMGRKDEKKKGHLGMKLAVVGLAVVGAAGLVKKGKRWVKEKTQCILGLGKKNGAEEL